MQPDGTLRGRTRDYLLQPLQGGRNIPMTILPQNGTGFSPFNSNVSSDVLLKLAKKYDFSCGMKCRLIWDGYGRWEGDKWKPYLKAKQASRKCLLNNTSGPTYNTLWIYGDSQAERMHTEMKGTPFCGKVFKSCGLTYNWAYKHPGGDPPDDNLDFNQTIVLNEIRKVLEFPEMSENSVLVLNLGYHYLQAISFARYVKLLQDVVELIKSREREGRKSVRMIWKTTMSLSKEKDTKDLLHSEFKRFLTNPRIAMFNAYATSFMCRKGFEVLDVHPLSASYPDGTGGKNVDRLKENDIVHFKSIAMKPFEDTFAEYFMGHLPEELNIENYQLS